MEIRVVINWEEKLKGGWCNAEDITIEQAQRFEKEANEYFPDGWQLEYRG